MKLCAKAKQTKAYIVGHVESYFHKQEEETNPIVFAMRRPVTTSMLVVALISGGVLGLYKMRVDIPPLNTPKIHAYLDYIGTSAKQMKGYVVGQLESYFHKHEEQHHEEHHKIVATSPQAKAVTLTQQYVCQIHSQRHIKVRALERGYLEAIPVKEGQAVKEGDLMFKVIPVLYQAKLDAENGRGQARATGVQLHQEAVRGQSGLSE